MDLKERGDALENEYFRKQEQELIAKMKAKLESETSELTSLKCPKCEGRLIETDFENVKIDACNSCHGVWLDAGELAQIINKDESESGWFNRFFK